jgi:hypothetical protein
MRISTRHRHLVIALAALALWQTNEAHAQSVPPNIARPRLVDVFSSWQGKQDGKVRSGEMPAFLKAINAAIDGGADIDAPDQYGNNPLLVATYWAAWGSDGNNFNDLVALLLSRGANPNAGGKQGTPMFLAATGTSNTKVIDLLCDAGASISAQVMVEGRLLSVLEMSRLNTSFPEIKNAMERCASKAKTPNPSFQGTLRDEAAQRP